MRNVAPELVKGLVVHSATLADMDIEDEHRIYYGAGAPRGESMALFDRPNTFTTIHEVELRTGLNWEKRAFPMPACLINLKNKFKGAVTLTLAYAPLVDAAFGEECVRTCVEVSFRDLPDQEGSGEVLRKDGRKPRLGSQPR